MKNRLKVVVEGDYACFTRPELKVERVSYDVPTPGALEGLLKSVYWKPAFRYVIHKIVVFNPIDFINIRRNEVKNKVSYNSVKKLLKGENADPSIYTSEVRTQRSSMILKNVRYGIEFSLELTGLRCERETGGLAKHNNILINRLEKGQCFRMPCLGCSELSIRKIELVDDFDYSQISDKIVSLGDVDLGYMCYKVQFEDNGIPVNNDWENPVFSDKAKALFYRPHMINGIIDVNRYREAVLC
ncbi:MAG: type I-C CRISPR-associated protein Cas5 [Eubacteriaceae bacterium]|nr:type I-C CRISPR-associated protein Cas5 [Eubacteriaceae bacterium]